MAEKLLIARVDTFTKAGRYVARGSTVRENEVDYDPENSDNLIEAPGDGTQAVVEISAIAPTGPNPQNPQQIAPDVVQVSGGYEQAGARLVGEVTLPEKQRIEIVGIDKESTAQADNMQALADADAGADQNVSNAGTEGTVPQVSARVAEMNADQLDQLERAENDREQPRAGVLSAIEKRRASLEG